jgi:uncharacterized protein
MTRRSNTEHSGQGATDQLRIRVVPSIASVPASAWDACANPAPGRPSNSVGESMGLEQLAEASTEGSAAGSPASLEDSHNPFISHAFLAALEESGSATAKTGWMPHHLVAEAGGAVVGVVPCYLKTHSRGEYVFDRGWAEAYERAGGNYYPNAVLVPFVLR